MDDDEDILKIVNKILTSAGFQVFLAKSAEEARASLEVSPPHLIISDLRMEPEDGYSFISKVKDNKNLHHIPIIVLSAVNDFNSVKKVIGLGINDYVIKPLQAPVLLRKIRKALHNVEFATWVPEPHEAEELVVKLPAEIIEMGEIGFRISGPFKLPPENEIHIQSKETDEFGMGKMVLKTSEILAQSTQGNFVCDIGMVGVSEESSSKIRQFVLKRNQG